MMTPDAIIAEMGMLETVAIHGSFAIATVITCIHLVIRAFLREGNETRETRSKYGRKGEN